MSREARIVIAVATLFFGTCFLLFAVTGGAHNLPAGAIPFYFMAALCYATAIVCLGIRSRLLAVPVVLVILGSFLWLMSPNASAEDWVHWAIPIAPFFAMPILVGVGLYLYRRWRDRVWFRATGLARAGDVEGALALLQERLRMNGPSARIYSQLALLHSLEQNWPKAVHMAEEAERMGDPPAAFLGTKGMALWKLGRAWEALACLEQAARLQPNDLLAACNHGCLLAELGRTDEASDVLARAERLFQDQMVIGGAAARQVRRQALEYLRRKVSGG